MRQYQLGLRGRPRFKGQGQFHAVEGKSNRQGIRWRDDTVQWGGRTFRARIDRSDPVVAHGLDSPVKYVRIVRRMRNGKPRFFVQLVGMGRPYQRPQPQRGTGRIGLDPGLRTFGIAGDGWGAQVDLATPLRQAAQKPRRLQRKLDRQRRANNPANYLPDGRITPGPKRWVQSKRQQRTRAKLADAQRRAAAHRKSLHGQLANALLRLGDDFRIEKNSYRSFQKTYGKAVGQAAPATFVTTLLRKAGSAGAAVTLVPTALRLSQTCVCGRVARKRLSERVHRCPCGIVVQRDVFSAWLARCAEALAGPDGPVWRLDVDDARRAWSGTEPCLPTASSRLSVPSFAMWAAAQSASDGSWGAGRLAPSGAGSEQIVGTGGPRRGEAADAVPSGGEPQKAPLVPPRTPRL